MSVERTLSRVLSTLLLYYCHHNTMCCKIHPHLICFISTHATRAVVWISSVDQEQVMDVMLKGEVHPVSFTVYRNTQTNTWFLQSVSAFQYEQGPVFFVVFFNFPIQLICDSLIISRRIFPFKKPLVCIFPPWLWSLFTTVCSMFLKLLTVHTVTCFSVLLP